MYADFLRIFATSSWFGISAAASFLEYSVLNVISVTELFYTSNAIAGTYLKYYKRFIITSVIYFFLTFTLTAILKYVERKIDGPQNFEFLEEVSEENSQNVEISGGKA